MCVDDAQWLDAESLHALGFAARRLHAEGITILFGMRSGSAASTALDGLPTIELTGLDAADAVELLRRSIDAPISDDVASRIVDTTAGNPLALIDLGQELTAAELSGATAVPDPIPLGDQLQVHYRQQIDGLTVDTRSWLLAAAAEPSADVALVAAAARAMGIDPSAADDAEAAGVVVIRTQVRFRHPLVRSAVYGGATPAERRDVHRALASVMLGSTDATRRAWHLAAAATDVDDDLADELERCADEARSRGGRETVATLLARAADLTGAALPRAQRLVSAAESAFAAGSLVQARALLDRCAAGRHGRRRHRASVGAAGARRHPPRRTERRARRRGPLSRGGSHRRRTHDRRTRRVARRMRTLGRCGGVRRTGRCAGRRGRDRAEWSGRRARSSASRGCSPRSPRVVGGRWRDAVECVRSATDALDADEVDAGAGT